MEKGSVGEETKVTEVSFPMILSAVKEKEDDSNKSLFKNDSLSSEEQLQRPPRPPRNMPELDQIKRFLKKADALNTTNFRKLKEDQQIQRMSKHDRSVSSLYKGSRRLEYEMEAPRQPKIKRIYLGKHPKPKKVQYPVRRRLQQVTKEVQTDIQNNFFVESQKQLQLRGSFNSMEFIEDSRMYQKEGRRSIEPIVQIREDAAEESQLPRRIRKGNNRGKVFSITTGFQQQKVNSYLESMSKVSFQFQSGLSRMPATRYKEYQEQQTIFSKTLDVRPLIPRQNASMFPSEKEDSSRISKVLKSSLTKVEQEPNTKEVGIGLDQSQFLAARESLSRQAPSKQLSIRQTTHKKTESRRDSISVIAERSEKNTIIRSIDEGIRFAKVPSSPAHKQSRSRSKNSSPFGKSPERDQNSYLVQVPSVHELRIGPESPEDQGKRHHPIHQIFGDRQAQWILSYRPQNQVLRGVRVQDWIIKKYKNGVYFGEVDGQGRKEGKGVIFYYNGKLYEGELLGDVKMGKGHEYYPDGSWYRGDFRGGLKEGKGSFEWVNGQVYEGQWLRGRKNGSGMWKGVNGDSYIGEWKSGKVEGFGVFVTGGSRYEGEFKNSLKHGVGTERFANGETYVGQYQKNRPNGEGEYYWTNGDYYKGHFSNGLRHGLGLFKDSKSGSQYRGDFRNDRKCGIGLMTYKDGSSYEGAFQNNLRHGFGELREGGLSKYRGYWVNDATVDSGIVPIKQQELERQQSLPQIVGRSPQRLSTHFPTQQPSKARISKSPPGQKSLQHVHGSSDDKFKRSCGCNKKH